MYETIRQQLIKMFAWNQSHDPDDLADETIDRVMRRVREIRHDYSGDPRLYFFGVAKNILREARRRESKHWSLDETEIRFQTGTDENNEQLYECLDKCMLKLPPDRRALLLSYIRVVRGLKLMPGGSSLLGSTCVPQPSECWFTGPEISWRCAFRNA